MLDSVDFATLLQYSPRGLSDLSKQSRGVKDRIKAGRIENYKDRISAIVLENKDLLFPYLNKDALSH